MTTRQYLQQAYRAQKKIEALERQITDLRMQLYNAGVSSPSSESERVQTSRNPDPYGELIGRIDIEERRLSVMLQKQIDTKSDVFRRIEALTDPKQHEVLQRRYILFQRWEQIAAAMNFDMFYLMKIRNRAEDAFYEMWGGELKLTRGEHKKT